MIGPRSRRSNPHRDLPHCDNRLSAADGEPFDSPLILSLSKDEHLAQDRPVEP